MLVLRFLASLSFKKEESFFFVNSIKGGGGGRGEQGGTRVSRFPYHVLPPPVLLCPFRLIKRIRKPGLTFKLCQNLTFLFIFRFIFLFSGSQQTIETIVFFISAPASNPHIYPSSRPLLSRFLPSPVPSSPGLPLPCPLRIYKRESDWMSIQPIEDPDR